jgi:crossover junction endodeoxyribonuclease RuvC
VQGNRLGFVACGQIVTDADESLANRLVTIHNGLSLVVSRFAPSEAAAEATFVNKDAVATLKLGQARGVALLAPARARLPVCEYAPNLVKKTIVGTGHGDKAQIRMMVRVLLPHANPETEDAADALAIAITHAHHRQTVQLERVRARAHS